ncbi:hypothetical protein LBMAG42_23250 [Deltaproteobacteria bacterium]|nr:hypothetical protein LBMAG42_23250 [Deltaproteobacteria bacterium]
MQPRSATGIDNDGDGAVDVNATDAASFYADSDEDGFGDPALVLVECEATSGYVANDDDCEDGDAALNPDAPEGDCADPNDCNCDGSVAWADADGGRLACVRGL